MDWAERIDEDLEHQIIAWRRHLHANPELSFQEHETTRLITGLMHEWGIPMERPLETGVVARVKGGKAGPTIAVRCDIDALPIQEENAFDFVSTRPGVMHACGHDGHTAILLGLAKVLSEIRPELCGEVRLLFQPAEEVLESGARHFIDKGVLDGVDLIIGLHLLSDLEVGKISLRPGPIMASADEFQITVVGRGGHGANPHQTIDSLVIASSLVSELQTLVSRRIDPLDPVVLSVGTFHAGTAFNIIPSTSVLTGTVRTLSESVRDLVERELTTLATKHALAYGAAVEVVYRRGHPSLANHEQVVGFLKPAVAATVGSDASVEIRPLMGAEDFAAYSMIVPSAFAFVGSRNASIGADFPHHHPRFTVDERALGLGLRFFIESLELASSSGASLPKFRSPKK